MYLFVICIIYWEQFTKVFSATWTSHWTTGSLVKPSISGRILSENAPWVPGIPYSLTLIVMTIFEFTSCISVLKCFNCWNSLVHLPFLLCHYIRQYNQMGKSWSGNSHYYILVKLIRFAIILSFRSLYPNTITGQRLYNMALATSYTETVQHGHNMSALNKA